MKPLFTTQNLELHRATLNDLDFLYKLYQSPQMMAYLGGVLTKEIIVERLKKWEAHWEEHGFGLGVVRLTASSQEVGVCILFHTEIEGEKLLEIGWMVDVSHQGRNFAFEIAKSYMDFALNNLNAKAIVAFPSDENRASNRICEKLGFHCVGKYRYRFLDRILDTNYWRSEFESL